MELEHAQQSLAELEASHASLEVRVAAVEGEAAREAGLAAQAVQGSRLEMGRLAEETLAMELELTTR